MSSGAVNAFTGEPGKAKNQLSGEIQGYNEIARAYTAAGESRVAVGDANYGEGSSREHAPWVFEVNDIHTVIAESYARIFRQNMFNCGMLAIELPKSDIDALLALEKETKGAVDIQVQLQEQKVVVKGNGQEESFAFEISPFDKALVEAGGWVEYADARY